MKKLLVFDYDNTIAYPKSPPSPEMISLMSQLLKTNYIAILTGGRTYKQLKNWLVKRIPKSSDSKNIFLCTEYGNLIYQKKAYWRRIYHSSKLEPSYKDEILKLWKDLDYMKYGLESNWQGRIVYKETLLSIECLNKNTVFYRKDSWDTNMEKRIEIAKYFKQKLPFNINIYVTGKNTIDFVEIGKDKGSNILRLSKLANIDIGNIEFFGDEFKKYGNDYPTLNIGVKIHKVKSPEETLSLLNHYV